MKYIFLISTLFVYLSASDLTIEIENLKSDKGNIKVGLYKDAKSFPKSGKSYKYKILNINSKTCIFKDLPNGEYAVAIYHDENKNKKLDKFLGIPTENYAFSNNAKSMFGPASFDEAKFELNKDMNLKINIGY